MVKVRVRVSPATALRTRRDCACVRACGRVPSPCLLAKRLVQLMPTRRSQPTQQGFLGQESSQACASNLANLALHFQVFV